MQLTGIACRALIACALATGSAALAQGAGLEPRVQNNVQYVTGGVGTEQQEALNALHQQGYNLRLVFAERGTGAYLANVHVVLADAGGRTVLDTVADGPALYAKLPSGRYQVLAEHKGIRQTRNVTAGGGEVTLYWAPEGGSAPEPAAVRAPHGDAPPLVPSHAGEAAGAR